MDVTVILPQHGRSGLTVDAVRSLQREHSDLPRIVVVDDGSPMRELRELHTASMVRTEIYPTGRQRGVTAAWNLGWQQARGEILVFLNNDTLSTGPWLSTLTAPLRNGEALMAGVSWRRERHLPAGVFPRVLPSRDDEETSRPPMLLAGWCFAIRRDLLDRLGGFDERFRLYFSDTDLQCRLLAGVDAPERCLHMVPGLAVHHLGHQSTSRLPSRNRWWHEDHQQFLAKWRRKR
jgi:GT2 family glycosyltransferase